MTRQRLKTQLSLQTGRVLVVDDHAQARASISDVLRQAGHEVECVGSAVEAVRRLEQATFDLVMTDLQMPGMSGLEFVHVVEQRKFNVQIVMITAHATVDSAVEAIRHGAFDYLEKPFDVDRLEGVVGRAIEQASVLGRGTEMPGADDRRVMIGTSPEMDLLRTRIAQVAPTSETVLIVGESGTGKELVARSIHAASRRAAGPLVSLNCPVLSDQLMESELFGHSRGAFTGAEQARTGRFESADGGTILLDEVSEIRLPLQAKLLRVLQEKSFERVGSSETLRVDVRVLATTNRDFSTEIAAGRFRQDLYYRLAVVPLMVPPLRSRRVDIPLLIEYFLQRAAERLNQDPCTLSPSANDLLCGYHWPGNIRELENIVTRASVLSTTGKVSADDLRSWLMQGEASQATAEEEFSVGMSLQEMERRLIEATLEQFGGHRAETAKALGIGVRTLSGKLRDYGYAPREKSFSKAG
jgi:DNA-binding NtrC family response regulator